MPAESPQQSALRQILNSLQTPSVRALAWSVLSAPLVTCTTETKHLISVLPTLALGGVNNIIDFLHKEDQAPSRLHQHLAQRSSHFLGPYFESLWAYFFHHTDRYQVTAQNLQIHHQGKTLGEFDFILWDTVAKQHIHVELAAKFYLQIRNRGVHNKYFPNSTMSWIGPNQIDRLDLKIAALLDKQLIMAEHPVAKIQLSKLGVSTLTTRTLLKGMLFPEIIDIDDFLAYCLKYRHQNHCGWLSRSNFSNWMNEPESTRPGTWFAPDKLDWLAPLYHSEQREYSDSKLNSKKMQRFLDSIEAENRPKMLAHIATTEPCQTTPLSGMHQELFRLFVTPDGWPAKFLI
ncbi:MAG: DUF1853 family protein [Hahellaceae bacterium]|nr:DUF1853 family protein [Hahellaceae bacterium]